MTPSHTPGRKDDHDDKMGHRSDDDESPSVRRHSASSLFGSPMMTPSMMTPAYKRNAPHTAATESMTPMTVSPQEEPLSASSQPSAAPTTAPVPRGSYEDDVRENLFPENSYTPHHRAAPQDRPSRRESPRPPIPARVELSQLSHRGVLSTSSLPEPPSCITHVRSSSASSSSNNAILHAHHRTSSSSSLIGREEPWVNDRFGIQERRRPSQEVRRSSSTSTQAYSSTTVLRKSSFQTPRNHSSRRSMKLTPDTVSSGSESSPDVSPSPDRAEKRRRLRPKSPQPESERSLMKWLYSLKRIRTNRLVLILCLVGMTSLGVTVLTSRAVIPPPPQVRFRPDMVPLKPGIRGSGSMMLRQKKTKRHSEKEQGLKDSKKHNYSEHTKDKDQNHYTSDHKHTLDHKLPSNHKHEDQHSAHHDKNGKDKPHAKHEIKDVPSTMIKPMLHMKVAKPKPLKDFPPKSFDTVDGSMYKKPATHSKVSPRIMKLHESASPTPDRHVESIYSEVLDNTQLYGVLDSDDERLGKMEMREPYSQGECVPMQEWQTTFHPSCNGMHELPLEHMGEDNGNTVNLFGTKGYWRNAWKLDFQAEHDAVVLKTLKFQHNFEDAHFEHDRIDAVAMERLTASPHVINVFGYCGHSVLTEYADGKRLGELADKSKKTPLARLKIARDIAEGLADVHGIDGDNNATFVHLDVNPANVVSIGGRLKLNDFNIGIILRWNTTSNTQCGFPAQYPNPQWRSPEEARGEQNLSEKVDVFSMGHIFFRLICGHEPWNKLEPGGKPSKEEVNEKVKKGLLPYIPEEIRSTSDPELVAIRDVMLRCYTYDPKDRPSAREIANTLDMALSKLTSESAS